MEPSKPVLVWLGFPPVQAWLGFPPVQADRDSPNEGNWRLAGTWESWELHWGSHWSWKLQDRLLISSKSPGLSDCLGEANVDRIGDPKSFWRAVAFDGSPKDSNNRFVWKVRWRRGAFRWWNRHDGWSLGLESRFFNHSTDCWLRTRVGREQCISLVLGRRGTVEGSLEETCLDAERCVLGKESGTSLPERKVR